MFNLKSTVQFWLIFVLILPSSVLAGKYAGEFLEIGVGARALGMGRAGCALQGDESSFLWNPAGLAELKSRAIIGMYTSLFGDFTDALADYNHMGFALPLKGEAVLALNWIRLSVDDIPIFPDYDESVRRQRIIEEGGEPHGYFSDIEDAFFFSFAKMIHTVIDMGWLYFEIPIDIPVGINLKVLRQSLYDYKASGIGVDVGVKLRCSMVDVLGLPFLGYLSLGLNVQDLTRTGISWGGEITDAIPRNFKRGLAYEQPLGFFRSSLTFSYEKDSRYRPQGKLGLEFNFVDVIFLRVGSEERGNTAGAGLKFWRLVLDYAYQEAALGNLHRISVAFRF